LHVNRVKNGMASVHPLGGEEIRALRRVKREGGESCYVFTTEREGSMTTAGFRKMLARTGEATGLPLPLIRICCVMRRDTLANKGVDTRALQHHLGHTNIQHTVRFTELAADRFNEFWRG
jgi:type 1 fimbriae regulatory protein FimB/type 1 fimbriae regulatory protein FimE